MGKPAGRRASIDEQVIIFLSYKLLMMNEKIFKGNRN